uniref:peptidylprolyl isomerase n=1 Tax=Cannabis sativa TaxID=3483 RepID=A0A803NX48_CANSA
MIRNATVEQIWPLLADFFNFNKWFPTLATCQGIHGTNGEVGCIRYCSGFSIPSNNVDDQISSTPISWSKERLIAIDHDQHSLSYEILESNIGFQSYVSTFRIYAGGSECRDCVIEWSFTVDPVEGLAFDDLVRKYDVGLQRMAQRMEASFENFQPPHLMTHISSFGRDGSRSRSLGRVDSYLDNRLGDSHISDGIDLRPSSATSIDVWFSEFCTKVEMIYIYVDGAPFEADNAFGTSFIARDCHGVLIEAFSTYSFSGSQLVVAEMVGIEVKPGKPYPYHSDNVPGRLHVTQATLGLGSTAERSIVQCAIGHRSPIFLCSLLPNKNESCSLNLEFEEEELVAFSVIGPRSVHLSGYFEADEGDTIRDDYESDSFGEDIADSETESSDFDNSDDGDEFIDDDLDMFPDSPVPNSGVVIEEIEDDEKPTSKTGQSKPQKKNQSKGSEDSKNSQHQAIVKKDSVPVLESEDEDGFPVSNKHGSNSNVQKPELEENSDEKEHVELKSSNVSQVLTKMDDQEKLAKEKSLENEESKKKRKKNKKKSQDNEGETNVDQTVSAKEGQKVSTLESDKQTKAKSSKVRTFANGLVVEELSMGKPDGKKAAPGKQVSVHYIGKLKKNGKQFDANVGRAPFKFRLGLGQVIKGWDVGLEGMRVGDKRRLTIPPEMGYGRKGAGSAIPPNSWLVFDVELNDVR